MNYRKNYYVRELTREIHSLDVVIKNVKTDSIEIQNSNVEKRRVIIQQHPFEIGRPERASFQNVTGI
jgi:hypothetical protein